MSKEKKSIAQNMGITRTVIRPREECDIQLREDRIGKYFKKYLPAEVYRQYLETYSDSSTRHFWKAIDTACGLFHRTAQFVAEESGFRYPQEDEEGFRKYAEIVKSMQSYQSDEAGKE